VLLRLPACVLLTLCLVLAACKSPTPRTSSAPLILVSIDGFRWDYLEKFEAPTLRALAASGVHARRLLPSFPSKTFPNHYTLVTGLRPEHHGIVSNYFYDPALQASFSKNLPGDNADARWWQQGEPIWITAEKQGVRSGTYFWPGSDAENHGLRSSLHQGWDPRIGTNRRVDEVLGWLALPPGSRPRFAALYLNIVDVVGHKTGPDSPEIAAAVQEVDQAVARLLAGLERQGLREQVNLIIVSDHGMAEQSLDRIVYLDDLVDLTQVRVESTGANGGVSPLPGTTPAAVLVNQMRAKAPPQIQIYLRDETPARLHFRANARIPEIVFIADEHWNVETRAALRKFTGPLDRGNHGWDPALPSMGAIFIASGPAFRRNVTIGDVENIHLYNLLCATLGIKPAPNDGDARLVREVLVR
jgi:predicted AlkP superfamily pyrophosphatase or phosphodiesterase